MNFIFRKIDNCVRVLGIVGFFWFINWIDGYGGF